MALYDGFFDAARNEDTGDYDRTYDSGDFTQYFGQMIGSGVCVHNAPDSFKVRVEDGAAVISPGYLFIQGYWLKNDEDYPVELSGDETLAITARLNLGKKIIELDARSVEQAYPDSLVLALVDPAAATAEDTRYNTSLCGVIEAAGELSSKVQYAINYIDSEIDEKLAQIERDINAQAATLDKKIAEVQAVADSIVPPPVGTIKFSASRDVGPEWLRCDGSFVNEADYPELVEALGKLTPSGDKFKLISDGEIGPQISNGVVYGGKIWVYSYSAKKLYGVDLDGTETVKQILVTSEDERFKNFIQPTSAKPLALSILPNETGTKARLFLSQIIQDGSMGGLDDPMKFCLVFQTEFTGLEDSLSMAAALSKLNQQSMNFNVNSQKCIPYVTSIMNRGVETFYCCISGIVNIDTQGVVIRWEDEGVPFVTYIYGGYHSSAIIPDKWNFIFCQRLSFNRKNKGESVFIGVANRDSTSKEFLVISSPRSLFYRDGVYISNNSIINVGLTVPGPANIVGKDKLLFEYSKTDAPSISISELTLLESFPIGIYLPSAARTFVDAAAYLWGKDIFMIFVGTGIIFSRTLEEGSFGYLDTTGILGAITQFGYLDYSQDENTLYLLGQDTENKVKVAKMELNTLYDYANDGAWLPMLASDGVPAYIKAKEAE